MAIGSKVLVLCTLSFITAVLCQEMTDEALDKRALSSFAKRARFAFAKRYPSKFAFAKRYDEMEKLNRSNLIVNVHISRTNYEEHLQDMDDYEKRAMRFAFAKRSMRNFAFAKPDPYMSFA